MNTITLEKPVVPSRHPKVVFVCPQEVKDKLEKLAAKNTRTVSNQVLAIVIEYLAKAEEEGII
ncbi:ribbon-helix-helix domain-containing protein [Floridanema evergladense]|uniref:Arc family DNA-binding protein n=1 Tax=Floridaenema evergladense BLCC-F167 TaxID=3153639 RepID=A0ABV4WQD9_9CYAN